VFDLSQTEGEPLPDISLAVENKGDGLYQSCRKLAQQYRITVDVTADFKVYGFSKGGEIVLRDDTNKTAMAATLIHEIAHELLHQRGEQTLDRETKELEAETIAYIVCSHFGIEVPSHKYLATWQKNHQIMASLQRISECSHLLLEQLIVV
jgi:hypothetical protein